MIQGVQPGFGVSILVTTHEKYSGKTVNTKKLGSCGIIAILVIKGLLMQISLIFTGLYRMNKCKNSLLTGENLKKLILVFALASEVMNF